MAYEQTIDQKSMERAARIEQARQAILPYESELKPGIVQHLAEQLADELGSAALTEAEAARKFGHRMMRPDVAAGVTKDGQPLTTHRVNICLDHHRAHRGGSVARVASVGGNIVPIKAPVSQQARAGLLSESDAANYALIRRNMPGI